jgi:hypothetical protein
MIRRRAAGWLCAAVLLSGSGWTAAHPAIVVGGGAPALREAAESARSALPDARIYGTEDAEQLKSDHPDVVIAVGAGGLRVASGVQPMPPMVFVLVADPEAIVGPLGDRPITGIRLGVPPEMSLEILRKLQPGAHELWTVYSHDSLPLVEKLREVAAHDGYHLTAREASDQGAALRELLSPPPHVDAFVMLPDRVVRNAAADEALMSLAAERGASPRVRARRWRRRRARA